MKPEGYEVSEVVMATVGEAIEAVAQGRMVIVCDDADREGEGDLVMASEFASQEAINFMISYGRGLVCLPMASELIDHLQIPEMVENNHSQLGTAFTVSIDAAIGITTGVSAGDRARTIRVAVDPASTSEDIVMPGHVFPLRAKTGGVLARPGHTEAATDLAHQAGLSAAGVICEIMDEDGTMARIPALMRFALRHGLPMITIAQIIEYRRAESHLNGVTRQGSLGEAWRERFC